MNFTEAFKMLEIEPTDDKKEIKVAYSNMLKKYHPEEFPEKFMEINEAYEKALGYVKNNFSEKQYENTQNFRKMGKTEDSDFSDVKNTKFKNTQNYKNTKNDDFSDILGDKNFKKSISDWIEQFKNLLLSERRTLEEYRKILHDFHYNFDVTEKNQIREILQKNKLRGYAWKNITRIEMELLIYSLNNSDKTFDILEEDWEDSNENENTALDRIVKNIRSANFEKNEEGYEEFIQEYFNIKIKNSIALYPYRDIEQVGSVLKFIACKIRNEYTEVNNYIKIFGQEQKNSLGTRISSLIIPYLWNLFSAIALFLFFLNPFIDWYIALFGAVLFIIFDWVNIVKEKNFEWSMKCGYSSYLFILMSILFVINLVVIGNMEYESSVMSSLLYSQLLYQYLFLSIILFIKMVKTSRLRYERLKKFSEKILDVFIFKK